MQRSRLAYAGAIAVVIAVGLFTRSSFAPFILPHFIRTYAGDVLWATMVFLGLGFLFPRASTVALGFSALGISFAVEFSQLIDVDWLNRIRATRLGALVLGRGWVATDLICYTVGVGIGVAGESAFTWRRR
ncbi:DUF2809 domain-containing protein [Luteolibacter flavescens]|uniref:DUF2809 domain-containing protein n=1 Tax=Luteolibacter flavescens TaxID=1859460 RepID=A0ABT3FV07_9BACT|nr:DUF2809 domain-containing protein [Luteolibacter flavescens]MCW1887420.1 DUF2809 domain-containing protein [Luteolibacter flavescens]